MSRDTRGGPARLRSSSSPSSFLSLPCFLLNPYVIKAGLPRLLSPQTDPFIFRVARVDPVFLRRRFSWRPLLASSYPAGFTLLPQLPPSSHRGPGDQPPMIPSPAPESCFSCPSVS